MTKNARFWDFINGQWVKITLRPGQVLDHYHGGATEEGFRWEGNVWKHDYDQVINECTVRARDCDGRMDYYSDYVCPIDELNAKPMEFSPSGFIPEWRRTQAWQRDYAAEAAGY